MKIKKNLIFMFALGTLLLGIPAKGQMCAEKDSVYSEQNASVSEQNASVSEKDTALPGKDPLFSERDPEPIPGRDSEFRYVRYGEPLSATERKGMKDIIMNTARIKSNQWLHFAEKTITFKDGDKNVKLWDHLPEYIKESLDFSKAFWQKYGIATNRSYCAINVPLKGRSDLVFCFDLANNTRYNTVFVQWSKLKSEYVMPQYPKNIDYPKISAKRFKLPDDIKEKMTPSEYEHVSTLNKAVKKGVDFLMNEPFADLNVKDMMAGKYLGMIRPTHKSYTIRFGKGIYTDVTPYFKAKETLTEYCVNSKINRFLTIAEMAEFEAPLELDGITCSAEIHIRTRGGNDLVSYPYIPGWWFTEQDAYYRITDINFDEALEIKGAFEKLLKDTGETIKRIKEYDNFPDKDPNWTLDGILYYSADERDEYYSSRPDIARKNLPEFEDENTSVYQKSLTHIYKQLKEIHDIVMDSEIFENRTYKTPFVLKGTLADYVSIDPDNPGLNKEKYQQTVQEGADYMREMERISDIKVMTAYEQNQKYGLAAAIEVMKKPAEEIQISDTVAAAMKAMEKSAEKKQTGNVITKNDSQTNIGKTISEKNTEATEKSTTDKKAATSKTKQKLTEAEKNKQRAVERKKRAEKRAAEKKQKAEERAERIAKRRAKKNVRQNSSYSRE